MSNRVRANDEDLFKCNKFDNTKRDFEDEFNS